MHKNNGHLYLSAEHANTKDSKLRNAGYSTYLDSIFLQRLKGVSFLGVLDFVYELKQVSNRYDHTVCVAHLALKLSERLNFSPAMERAFVIAHILHDIGHAAFSHNSEPFLLEKLKLYHQGLLSTIFTHSKRFAPNGQSVEKLLRQEDSAVAETVTNLILQSRQAVQPLQTLFHCPLNCDKIEGNYRTLLHLQRESINPGKMLSLFEANNGGISIDSTAIELIIDFWKKERDVYWNDIYTSAVFSAEAMLTRALEVYFEGPGNAETFLLLTDDEALNVIRQHEPSRELIFRLQENRLFTSLRETHPEVLELFEEKLRSNRFNISARIKIESQIAATLDVPPHHVVSHFSRRKHFNSRFYELRQFELFETDPTKISLKKVEQAFQNSKKTGDFFDVFYLRES